MPTNDHAISTAEQIASECRKWTRRSDDAKRIPDAMMDFAPAIIAAAQADVEKERDAFRSEVARIDGLLRRAYEAGDGLRARMNALAADNGRLESRLEAVRQWTPAMSDRRAQLIEFRFRFGELTEAEMKELDQLQELFGRYQDAIAPLPDGEATRLEPTTAELEAAARIRQARAASDANDPGYPNTPEGRARSVFDHVLLGEAWMRLHPLPDGEREKGGTGE